MALIQCSECQREVSSKAAACPGCGAPISVKPVRAGRRGGAWEGVGFLLIVGGMLTAIASDPPTSTYGAAAITVGFVVFIIGRFL